ncbi:putative nucleoside-diphosphate-sugar epimerase [Xylariaceae sp. FL0016]|nr:putative nucleoside-diphosphate-sugar epimerase [Xylariaceae sp. FL0016]
MKLIVSGATGFVGKEVIRQSLSRKDITSVIALARKPVPVPENLDPGADPAKLRSIVIEDYDKYSDDVKKEFADAAACIWTVAITPSKSKAYEPDEVKRVCQTSTLAGLRAMHDAGLAKPFRFLYMSGAAAERDQTKTPKYYPEYCLMRGDTENKLLSLATELGGVDICVIKPGFITAPGEILKYAWSTVVRVISGIPGINVVDLAAVMLDRAAEGFDKEPLLPGDLGKLVNDRTGSQTTT